jgi:inorganic pyrophosphatase
MNCTEVIIETPKGSAQKYVWSKKRRLLKLTKILPTGMVFPFDFGFIPDTKGQDGDPLDIIVISEFASFPGCIVSCRIIGCMVAVQSESRDSSKLIRNDRFIGIPIQSIIYKDINDISNLPPEMFQELEQFFVHYNEMAGKKFIVQKKIPADKALKLAGK